MSPGMSGGHSIFGVSGVTPSSSVYLSLINAISNSGQHEPVIRAGLSPGPGSQAASHWALDQHKGQWSVSRVPKAASALRHCC